MIESPTTSLGQMKGASFTFAHYVEPMTSIAVTIYDLQNAISARIHHTWGIRIPTLT